MEFRSRSNPAELIPCPAGDKMRNRYQLKFETDGTQHLIKTGEYDAYELIQSFARECDINLILEKYAITGDPAVLNQREKQYSDVILPDNVFEAAEQVHQVIEWFDSLPDTVRDKIGTIDDLLQMSATSAGIDELMTKFTKKDGDQIAEKQEVNTNAETV